MPRVGFEPTITASERAKKVHALERDNDSNSNTNTNSNHNKRLIVGFHNTLRLSIKVNVELSL
jgi:hypothetical protein